MPTLGGRRPGEDTLNESGSVVSVTDKYKITMDGPSNTVEVYNILNSIGAPALGDAHPDLDSLKVVARDVEGLAGSADDSTVHILSLSYSNSLNLSQQSGAEDPLDMPPKYIYDQVDTVRGVEVDAITGNKILNSAKNPFAGITENFPLTRIIIERNEKTFSNQDASFFRNKTNEFSNTIDGEVYGANSVKIERITGTPQNDQAGNTYYKVVYSLLINPDSWERNVIDRGKVDINGKPPARNVKLDSEGAGYLSQDDGKVGEFLTDSNDDEVFFISFHTLDEVNIGPLNL